MKLLDKLLPVIKMLFCEYTDENEDDDDDDDDGRRKIKTKVSSSDARFFVDLRCLVFRLA